MQHSDDGISKSFDNDVTNTDTDLNSNSGYTNRIDSIINNSQKSADRKSFYLGSAAIQLKESEESSKFKDPPGSSTFESFFSSSKSSSPVKGNKFSNNISTGDYSPFEEDVVYPGDSSASESVQYNNESGQKIQRDGTLRSRASTSQLSRNSSVRFSTNPVVITHGIQDPAIRKWNSFSQKSILKDKTATPASLANDKLDVVSKAPSGFSFTAEDNSTNDNFISLTGKLEEPAYMSNRNIQKTHNILNEMSQYNALSHINLYENSATGDNYNSSDIGLVQNRNGVTTMNPFASRTSFSSNNSPDLATANGQAFLETDHANNPNGNDSISTEKSANSSQANSPRELSSRKNNSRAILICVFLTCLIAVVATITPFIVILSRGSESTVMNYFSHASPEGRKQTLEKVIEVYFNSSVSYGNPDKKLESHIIANPPLTNNKLQSNKLQPVFNISMLNRVLLNDSDIKVAIGNFSHSSTFDGLNYTPQGILYPKCEVNGKDVVLDLVTISKITNKIKTSGVQCNQVRYIIEAIQLFNINMKLSIGVLISKNKEFNNEQIKEVEYILDNYPSKSIESIFVGNEVVYRNITDEKTLLEYINRLKLKVNKGNLNISVGTSELGGKMSKDLIEASDVIGANIYPFFTGQVVQTSADWVFDYQQNELNELIKDYPNKTIVVTEVGWPYIGGKNKKAVAGPKHCQKFMSDFVCKSKNKNISYFYFGAFDDPSKKIYYKGKDKWQTEWGIFNTQRVLKPFLELPQCA